MKRIIAAVGLISLNFQCSTPLPAAEIILSTKSYHFFQKDTNNNNYGLHYVADNGFTTGIYHNSLYRISVHAGYSFHLYGPIGMSVGGVTGYDKLVNPYFSLNYEYPINKTWGITFTVGALAVVNAGISYKY